MSYSWFRNSWLTIFLWNIQNICGHKSQGRQKQPDDGPAKLSTIPRITGTQASRRSGAWNFWKLDAQYAIFGTFSLLAWKIYCTLHSRYKQHKMSVYKMTWLEKQTKKNFFFIINGLDKLDCFCRPWIRNYVVCGTKNRHEW